MTDIDGPGLIVLSCCAQRDHYKEKKNQLFHMYCLSVRNLLCNDPIRRGHPYYSKDDVFIIGGAIVPHFSIEVGIRPFVTAND